MAKRKKRKSRLTPEERAFRNTQRRFRLRVNSVFRIAGFAAIPTRNKEIDFNGRKGEFDNLFLFENALVIAEETCAEGSSALRDHLLKKDLFYKHLLSNKSEFIEFLDGQFPELKAERKVEYQASDINVIVAYCTKNRMEDVHKSPFPHIIFMEDRHVQYFAALASTLGKSMRFELFKFLGLRNDEIGITHGAPTITYDGFILPESPSGFPSGFKVVTLYIDPATLMPVSYVLRKDGWGDDENLYQRMISRSKIKSMRQFLAQEDRVFINNVIVSLPVSTKVLDQQGNQIELQKVVKTTPIKVQVPNQFNSIGIIDGQHRVFAYHEGSDAYEAQIAPKRRKQQLLLTGVVYPEGVTEERQREFEARLFLEINDKQTRTRPDLRQAIEAIVNPFSIIAISRSIVTRLAANGPLCGHLEEHQFDRGKLKSSSIVSYGLRHIVKTEGEDTLFKLWKHSEKGALAEAIKSASTGKKRFSKPSKATLDDYVLFCAKEINHILIGYKVGVPKELWTLNRKISRALSTTAVNGVIFCLRHLLVESKTRDLEGYKTGFKKLKIDFTPKNFKFKSSHWKELGERMAKECFT
jgi:DGQHR domain-containing protein